jgi:hypothetical protein
MIISNQINGTIDIWKTSLRLERETTTFHCGVCEKLKTDKNRFKCVSCDERVCLTCQGDMNSVGMIICPQCSGDLRPEVSDVLISSED